MLFTDEKTFELFGSPNNDIIWETSAEAVPARPTVKHPPKLHVWGGMCYYGKTELVVFTGSLTAPFYVNEILAERVPPDAARLFGRQPWVFQQDGDPKHTSQLAQAWLRDNTPAFIPKDDWPANSPDLNPMEQLWAPLQDRVYRREPRTVAGLQRIIEEEWNAIPAEHLHSLVESMPRRFNAVIAARGGPTKY